MQSSRVLSRSNANFMSQVYFWMMFGMTLSGISAYATAHSPYLMQAIFSNKFIYIGLMIVQVGAVLVLAGMINRLNALTASLIYIGYCALTGVTFSALLLVFTNQSIVEAFFITTCAFAGLSAYGFMTKRDLGPVGSFCMTGLFGLIGFIIVTMLFPSIRTNSVSMTIDVLTILIFSGLTAYDTQRIKSFNIESNSTELVKKEVITGALMLYLDFINLFLSILRLFGDRR